MKAEIGSKQITIKLRDPTDRHPASICLYGPFKDRELHKMLINALIQKMIKDASVNNPL